MSARLANKLWLASARLEHMRFTAALQNPGQTQDRILAAVLTENRSSQFGLEHDFDSLTPHAFRKKVPVRSAAEYEPWLSRAAETENVLTVGRILYFEKTSGSTGKPRLIPCTVRFRAEINRAVLPWMVSLSHSYPAAFHGPSYWSISPPLRGDRTHTPSGIRIGAADAEYLTLISRILLSQILAVPQSVTDIQDPDEFYFQTLRCLLLARSLSMISIWSPAFLTVLDEHLRKRWLDLLDSLPASQRRKMGREPGTWKEIWPGLVLCSCWTDSWASRLLPAVRAILGNAAIQGKGLLATEGVSTIPFQNQTVLAVRSHFYEFRDEAGNTLLPAELEKGSAYEVILTTSGGLYRFATGDLVEVTGFLAKTPCLKFLGRNLTTDLVGEKVTEAQAALCIGSVLGRAGLDHAQAVFLPDPSSKRYTLLIHCRGPLPGSMDTLAAEAESILCENPYYSQARALGELGAVHAAPVSESEWNMLFARNAQNSGSRAGHGRVGTQKAKALLNPAVSAQEHALRI